MTAPAFPMPAAWDWRKLDHQATPHEELILALNRKLTELSQLGAQYTAFGPYYPIVTGELGVTDVRYPFGNLKRYGALGDGAANDSPAAQAWMLALALADAPTRIGIAPAGRYHFATEVNSVSNILVWAYGATFCSDVTTAPARIRSMFYVYSCTNVAFCGAHFDLGQPVVPTFVYADDFPVRNNYNQAMYGYQSTDITVTDCQFTNLYTAGLRFYQCYGKLHLTRNVHTSPVQVQVLNGVLGLGAMNAQHIEIQGGAQQIVVDTCRFDNAAPPSATAGVCGFYASGTTGSIKVVKSDFIYCGRNSVGGHQLGAFTCYGDNVNVDVQANVFTQCLQQVLRLSVTVHGDIAANIVSMASVAGGDDQIVSIEGTYVYYPGEVGCRDLKLHHNSFRDDYSATRVGISAMSNNYACPLQDISIHENTFVNMKSSVKLAGPYNSLWVERNQIRGSYGGQISYTADPGGQVVSGASGVTEAASVCSDLRIRDNNFELASTGANAIILDFTNAAAYTGTIGDMEVSGNTGGAASVQFFVYRGVAGQGRLTLRKNRPDTYASAFDIANVAELTLEDNVTRNIPAANFLLLGAGIGTINRDRNRWSAGPLSGRAVLAAGTILVLSPEVVAGDDIILSNVFAGGVVGALSLGAIVPGVSFVINSTSGADTSTALWRFAH